MQAESSEETGAGLGAGDMEIKDSMSDPRPAHGLSLKSE